MTNPSIYQDIATRTEGSLFLGRMTNLFDGVSFVIEANSGPESEKAGLEEAEVKKLIAQALREFAQGLLKE